MSDASDEGAGAWADHMGDHPEDLELTSEQLVERERERDAARDHLRRLNEESLKELEAEQAQSKTKTDGQILFEANQRAREKTLGQLHRPMEWSEVSDLLQEVWEEMGRDLTGEQPGDEERVAPEDTPGQVLYEAGELARAIGNGEELVTGQWVREDEHWQDAYHQAAAQTGIAVPVDQASAAEDLCGQLAIDGLLSEELNAIGLLDVMACAGFQLAPAPRASKTYFEELAEREERA